VAWGKRVKVIASEVGVTTATEDETISKMDKPGFMTHCWEIISTHSDVFDMIPIDTNVSRQIVDAQRSKKVVETVELGNGGRDGSGC